MCREMLMIWKWSAILAKITRSKRHFLKRRGIGTLEVVIIIAVLLSVALIFRQALTAYATDLIGRVFSEQNVLDDIAVD